MLIASIADAESLDPAWHFDTASARIVFNVYEGLLTYNKERIDEFVPLLATGWIVSGDGKTFTFTIRKGVKFHEGGALEPHDFAYSVWRGLLQDRAGGPQWIFLEPLLGTSSIKELAQEIAGKEKFEEVDAGSLFTTCNLVKEAVTYDDAKGTVTFKLAKPWGPFLQTLAGTWILALDQEWVVKQGDWDGDCRTWQKFTDPSAEASKLFKVMNGTGPFKLERWIPGTEISVVRHDGYWKTQPLWTGDATGPAKLRRAVIKVVPEWGTRFAMLQVGDVDTAEVPRSFISQVDPLVKEEYKEILVPDRTKVTIKNPTGTLRVMKELPGLQASPDGFFTFNVNVEGGNPYIGSGKLDSNGIPPDFFSDVNVRRAFNYAFDWETFIRDAYVGEALKRSGPIIQGVLGYDPTLPAYSLDLRKAEEEFRKAQGGKVWESGFRVTLLYNTGNVARKIAGEILKQNIEKLNPKFKVEVRDVPFATLLKEIVAGRAPFFMLGWLEDYHHPNDWVYPYLYRTGTFAAGQRFPKELQAQFDKLIDEAVTLTDPKAAETAYRKIQALALEQAMHIYMVQPSLRHYEQLWVKGYFYNPAHPGVPQPTYFYGISKGWD